MNVIDGTGEIVETPDFRLLFDLRAERKAAREYWRIVTSEMRGRDILAPANGHAILRYVIGLIIFDRAAREVLRLGAVTRANPDNMRSIARIRPDFRVMREASADLAALETELGLSPRRRAAVTRVQRRRSSMAGADSFLAPKQ